MWYGKKKTLKHVVLFHSFFNMKDEKLNLFVQWALLLFIFLEKGNLY